ncbi:MAG: hypothetical protein E7430_00765 [Ruminococcaceae bacterium]|nr:hypothetical protein [Oscillospiraceae bacterium]
MNKVLGKDIIILDGATGTMLQQLGLRPGESPLNMNLRAPELVKQLHETYLKAGSNIICSNTFSASEHYGKGSDVSEAFIAAIEIAKSAAKPYDALVAADIGPIGRLLQTFGDLSADEAYEIFAKQAKMAEDAGADIIYFETMTDILETKIGILAAKASTSLPVFASMSFESNGKTFLGCSLSSMALTLQAAGANAVGINCSVGPNEAIAMAQEIVKWTDLPIIVKPNAGLPATENGVTVYNVTPSEFADTMSSLPSLGVSLMGGCCGTSPDFISALVNSVKDKAVGERPMPNTSSRCSSSVVDDGTEPDHSLDCRVSDDAKDAYSDIDDLIDLAMDADDTSLVLYVDGLENGREILKNAITELQAAVKNPLIVESQEADMIAYIDRYYRGKL